MSKRLLFVATLLVLASPFGLLAQQKKTAPKTPVSAGSHAKKALSENTCDGALDIVPTQAASFARKRRPSKAIPSEPKAEKKPEGNVQNPS